MSIFRKHILALEPYSSARDEFSGEGKLFLDANENSGGDEILKRYPDGQYGKLRNAIGSRYGIPAESITLGNGSDEIIDWVIRATCEPGKDKIVISSPTYGMYKVCAEINGVELSDVPLQNGEWNISELQQSKAKLMFICSPNNPTGGCIKPDQLQEILRHFAGAVVVDEAYADFSSGASALELVNQFPNLLVVRTFSKAWGLAGIRLGWCTGSPQWAEVLNKIRPPYNVNSLTELKALEALQNPEPPQIKVIVNERANLAKQLQRFKAVYKVWTSQANFILIQCERSVELYNYLLERGIVIRNRNKDLPDALRITVGLPEENKLVMNAINTFYND